MAQFKSSAREGSFSNNQLAAPDTVRKIKEEGDRRLQGMNRHDQRLKELNRISDKARTTAQNIESDGRSAAFKVEQDAFRAKRESDERVWKQQLQQEQNKDKYKFDTFGALAAFSKTAFDITANITKNNLARQQKAIKEQSYKYGVTTEMLKDIAALDSGLTMSAFQQSAYAQKLIKDGASQELLKFQYNDLYKGSGYRNYVNNGYALRNKALEIGTRLEQIDPDLSPEETRKEIARIRTEGLSELTVNGNEPRGEFLEQFAYPAIREAEKKALARVNGKIRQSVDRESRATQVNAVRNTWNPGDGVKRPTETLELLAGTASADTRRAMVDAVASDPATTIGDLRTLLSKPFEVNGQMRTLRDYPDEAAVLEQRITFLDAKARQDTEDDIKKKNLETEVTLQQTFDKGADSWTQEDQDELEALSESLGGPGYVSATVEATKKYVIDGATGQAADEWMERWTKRLEAGTATREMLEDVNLPFALEAKARQQLATIEGLRATPAYSSAITTQLENVVLNAAGLKYGPGEAKDPSVLWKIEKTKADFKELVSLYSITNPDNAVQMALDKIITDTQTELGAEGAVQQGRILQWDTYLSKQQAAQAEAIKEQDALTAVASNKTLNTNPENFANALNKERFIEQVQEYQITGDSQYLRSIGQLMGSSVNAPWEVIEQLAPYIDGVEPIDAPENWDDIVQFIDDEDRYNLFNGKSPQAARLRTLEQAMLKAQNRTSAELPVRPVFQTGQSVSLTGDFSEADKYGPGWGAWSRVLRYAEGTSGPGGEKTMFGFKKFDDLSDHPRQLQSGGGYTSDAAGAYQFLSTTWDGARSALGLQDFSLKSQEAAARHLFQNKRGVDPDKIIDNIDEFRAALDKLAPEWASFPYSKTSPGGFGNGSSYYGQGGKSLQQLWQIYQQDI